MIEYHSTKTVRVENLTTGSCLAAKAYLAATFWTRLKGLTGRRSLPPGSGMIITPCRAVHTWFLRFNLDLVFVSRYHLVCQTIEDLPPYQKAPFIKDAYYVIELPAGWIQATSTQIGNLIRLVKD